VRAFGAALAVAIAISLGAPSPALSQATASHYRDTFWIGAGLGAGSEDFAGSFNISYQTGANLFSFRLAATAGPLFDDGFSDVALLYGRATRMPGGRYQASAAVGLGVADGCRGGGVFAGCRETASAIGLPIEVQAFWRPARFIGFGFYGFANLNHVQSFAGLTLGLQLGHLR
jgi:hypothetical protein